MIRRAGCFLAALGCVALATAAPRIRIGVESNSPPLSFVDAQGRPTGFSAELLQAMMHAGAPDIEIVPGSWTTIYAEFRAGRLDALANVAIQERRRPEMDFSIGHAFVHGVIYTRRDRPALERTTDFAGKKIAVLQGSVGHLNAVDHQGWGATIVTFPSWDTAIAATQQGSCDAALFIRNMRQEMAGDFGLRMAFVDDVIHQYHFAVHKGDTRSLEVLNEALAVVRHNGSFDRLFAKWIGPIEPHPIRLADLRPYFLPGALVLLAVLCVFWWQRWMLGRLARQSRALQQSEERYRSILNASPDDITITDREGRIIMISPAARTMFGYERDDQALGRLVTDFIAPEDRARAMEQVSSRLRGVAAVPAEYRGLRHDGTTFDIEVNSDFLRDPEGSPTGMVIIARDITQRKQAEAALKASMLMLAKSQELGHIGSWEMDLARNRLIWSDEVYRIFGLETQEFDASYEAFLEAVHPEDRATVDTAYAGSLRERKDGFETEHRVVRRRTGEVRYVREKCTHFKDPGGAIVRSVGIVEDITERKQAEADRLILSKLESTGILAGGIAHDFNNLLTVVMLGMEMAKSHWHSPADLEATLQHATEAVISAQNLTRQLITFARGGEPVRCQTNLGPLVQQAVQVSLSGSNLVSRLVLADDLWGVNADAGLLGQALRNLVLNARDAMPGGGTVTVQAHNVTLAAGQQPALPPGDYVRLGVGDEGPGIPPDVLPKIFDPYFSTKQRATQKGMGLGLTICHSVFKRHGGAISVETAPGRGTTFYCYLPASRQPTPVPVLAPVVSREIPKSASRSARILIMDDESAVRTMIRQVLERMGHTAAAAADGQEAIDRYQEARDAGQSWDLVLLDLTVRGGLGGVETVRRLRELDPGVNAVVMSGYASDDVLQDYARYGFKDMLAKPFDHHALQAMLTRTLPRRTPDAK